VAKQKRKPRPKSAPAETIDWIAETEVVWVYRDRTRRPGRVAVARPAQRPTGEWGCRVEGLPMSGGTRTIYGGSSWQALLLAMQFIGWDVHHHVERGGKITWPLRAGQKRSTAYPPELLLGALFRAPKGS